MSAATELADRLALGVAFVYEANTLHEAKGATHFVGRRMMIKAGKWSKHVAVDGSDDPSFRMELPKSAKAVEWLDADRVRYAIVKHPEHFVTLRFVP